MRSMLILVNTKQRYIQFIERALCDILHVLANNTPPEALPEGIQEAYLTAESLRRGLVRTICLMLNCGQTAHDSR